MTVKQSALHTESISSVCTDIYNSSGPLVHCRPPAATQMPFTRMGAELITQAQRRRFVWLAAIFMTAACFTFE